MRRTITTIALALLVALGTACGGGGDEPSTDVTYDAEGFDENGCNRGERYNGGLCVPDGDCAEISEAMDAFDREHGFASPDGGVNQTDEQLEEYNRLVESYNENC